MGLWLMLGQCGYDALHCGSNEVPGASFRAHFGEFTRIYDGIYLNRARELVIVFGGIFGELFFVFILGN